MEKPAPQRPTLDYGDSRYDEQLHPNAWRRVLGRIYIGAASGIVSIVTGWFLAAGFEVRRDSTFLFLTFAPWAILFIVFLVLTIMSRKFGYISGLLFAPVLIGAIIAAIIGVLTALYGPLRP